MKLYKVKIPTIAKSVIETLCNEGAIEVELENRAESEKDLVAIMEEYIRRDAEMREAVKEHMSQANVPYDQFGKVRTQFSERWGLPSGDEVQRFLARQFIENFMISRFVDEVYAEFNERGAVILSPIANKPWGIRDFTVVTPDGHRIVFGQLTG